MNKMIVLILIISLVACLLFSFLGAIPGTGSWFTELAGDWSIKITANYEIGNSVDENHIGAFCIWQWEGYPKLIKDGVLDYNYNDEWIIGRTPNEWFWVNVQEHIVKSCARDKLQDMAPPPAISLSHNMNIPKPAYRHKARFMVYCLGTIFVVLLAYKVTRRNKDKEDIIHNARRCQQGQGKAGAGCVDGVRHNSNLSS